MYKPTTPRKTGQYACNKNHVGLYYYVAYWGFWDKVISVDGVWCTVVQCDLDGNPIAEPRRHCTQMNAAMYADHPFEITRD